MLQVPAFSYLPNRNRQKTETSATTKLWTATRPRRTRVWTTKQAGAQTDSSVPVKWMKANEPCNKWRIEVMYSLNVFIHVAAKILLKNTRKHSKLLTLTEYAAISNAVRRAIFYRATIGLSVCLSARPSVTRWH